MTKTYKCIKYGALFALLLMLSAVGGMTTMYGDDFVYGTYFLNGFADFWTKTCEHYLYTNGRALVHFVLELLLIFKDKLFFIAIPAMLAGVFFAYIPQIGARFSKSAKTDIFILFLAGVLCLDIKILREGVFWMAGALNYIFPLMLSLAAFSVYKKSIDTHTAKWYYFPVLFFCGATTEQCGVIAICVCVLYTFYKAFDAKKIYFKNVWLILPLVLGYLSVVLSPATSLRIQAESTDAGMTFFEKFDYLFEVVFGMDGIGWVYFSAFFLSTLRHKHLPAKILGSLVCAASVILAFFGHYSAAGWVMATVWTIVSVYSIFCKNAVEESILNLAALLSTAMLIMSNSYGYRNLIPSVLILLLTCATNICSWTQFKIHTKTVKAPIILATALIAITVFYPTFEGYLDNRKIINKNISNIVTDGDGFDLNVDLNTDYAYRQFDDAYYTAFKQVYGISDNVKVHIAGADFRDLYLNDERAEYPIFREEYYPMREVIPAFGGDITYFAETDSIKVTANGKTIYYHFETGALYNETTSYDYRKYILSNSEYGNLFKYVTYLSRDGYFKFFGIDLSDI